LLAWTLWVALALADDAGPSPLHEVEARGHAAVEAKPEVRPEPVVLAGGTVLTAAGHRYEPGWVALVEGRIRGVGEGEPPAIAGARVLDVTGHFVTPGLIDAHSHLGVYPSPGANAHGDGNEATAPSTAGVWAEHSVWPQDPGFHRAIAGGVTALQILPGSANLVGGRGFVAEVVPARGSRAMRFPGAPETVKMACGENPKRVYGNRNSAPSTRMGNARAFRELFYEAQRALEDWEAAAPPQEGRRRRKGGEGAEPPERDLDLETLVLLLRGEALAQVHCYRADDMLTILQLADEVGFEVRSFHHAVEAYKIRDILAERGVASSVWADWWGFKLEAYDGILENAALLDEAGVRAIIHSDSAIGIQRLNQEAAKAYHAGLAAGVDVSEDDALGWITANPAWALGIDHLTGTLEPGKRADVVVWDAHPFSVRARARKVFVEGVLRYDLDRPQVWSDFELGREVPR